MWLRQDISPRGMGLAALAEGESATKLVYHARINELCGAENS